MFRFLFRDVKYTTVGLFECKGCSIVRACQLTPTHFMTDFSSELTDTQCSGYLYEDPPVVVAPPWDPNELAVPIPI